MPGTQGPKNGQGGKRRFINEKVVKQPQTKTQIAKRILTVSAQAVLFGVIAAVSFAVSKPLADRYLVGEAETEPSISIPKDEPTEPTTAAPTAPEEETTAEQETEPVEKVVQSAMEHYRYTIDDVSSLVGSMRAQAQKVNKGIVVVHSVMQETDWFDNPVETTGQYAGAVIAETRQELLVLTPEVAVEQADSIKVTFADGSAVSGQIKQKDRISGMAIVSVALSDMKDSTLGTVETLPLGNSYVVKEGDLVMAVGSPTGKVHSIDYGIISQILKNVQMVDQIGRVLYSDVCADVDSGTFLVNTAGELVGWAMEPHQGDSSCQITEVMGISDYKGILEKLTNGRGAPCFGIMGQEVSESMALKGLPRGIYVTNSVTDGPAYNAGIQNGDIITMVDGVEITSMKEFQAMMDKLECEQLLHVTVQRNGRETFRELQFSVTVGAR